MFPYMEVESCFATASTDARTPALQINNASRWNSTLSYRFQTRETYTIKPLWLLESVPFLGPVGRLELNFVPQSFQTNTAFSVARS